MKRSLNLMSEHSRKREKMRLCMRFWSRALAVAVVTICLGGFAQWQSCDENQQRLASAELEYEPIRQLKIETARLSKEIEALQASEHIPLALASDQPLLSLVGLATRAVARHDGSVYLRQIEIEREPISEQLNRPPALTFALDGAANDSRAVTQLADALRNAGPFADVELSSNQDPRAGEQAQQAFSIQCTN